MAIVLPDGGIRGLSEDEHAQNLLVLYRQVFGSDLVYDVASVQGQMIGIDARNHANTDSIILHLARGNSARLAVGQQQDDLFSWLGILRRESSRSSVSLRFSGAAGTNIPANTRVASDTGVTFTVRSLSIIPDGATTIDVLADAIELGPVVAPAGTLTELIDEVEGITAVTNVFAATVGQGIEDDESYLARYNNFLFLRSDASIRGLEAKVRAVQGVTYVKAVENKTGDPVTVRQITIPANSVVATIEGGAYDVVQEVINRALLGTPSEAIRPTQVPVRASLAITREPLFSSTLLDDIRRSVASFINDRNIGEVFEQSLLYPAIYTTPAFVVTALSIGGYRGVRLVGESAIAGLTSFQRFNRNSDFNLTINGQSMQVRGLNYSGISSVNDAAGVLQAGIRATNVPGVETDNVLVYVAPNFYAFKPGRRNQFAYDAVDGGTRILGAETIDNARAEHYTTYGSDGYIYDLASNKNFQRVRPGANSPTEVVDDVALANDVKGFAFGGGNYYVLDSAGQLFTMNIANRALTLVGDTGIPEPRGLAFHNGVLYASSRLNMTLYSIAPASANSTFIGKMDCGVLDLTSYADELLATGDNGEICVVDVETAYSAQILSPFVPERMSVVAVPGNGFVIKFPVAENAQAVVITGEATGSAAAAMGFSSSRVEGALLTQEQMPLHGKLVSDSTLINVTFNDA